ncbi:MAG: hypothetical protein GYA16_15155 [Spirochaetes bacterium]|nr:hypothetical protein [Spirochaetota bacterium]
MGKKPILLLLVFFLTVCLSCATTPKDLSQLAFIFGRIESADGDMALETVDFISCSLHEKSESWEAYAHRQKGYFWLNDLKMGSYRAVRFSQRNWGLGGSSGSYYLLNKYGPGPFMVRIQKPGVYYMGTYKYGMNPKKLSVADVLLGTPATFSLVKVENDNPQEILEWILKNKISKKSPWYSIIEKTIKERSWINAEDTIKL